MFMASSTHHPAEAELQSIFSTAPIRPRNEVGAYESLWLGPGAWFANIAELFRQNPGALPSDLVPREEAECVFAKLSELYGDRLSRIGVRIHGAGDYPDRLREADHPVELLYFQGDWTLAEAPGVAVVGTRNPSDEGAAYARRISAALVREGFTVVSGLAKGIDTAAHTAAIAAGGSTIAVIGTPLFDAYPKENSDLQDLIAEKHLLISQVPFLRYRNQHYKSNRLFFPARNVTMSALTKATVIVEAGETSGTLVQARAAINQGRKLFILESCFRRNDLRWPAKFESLGAIRVRSIADILENLKEEKHVVPEANQD
jgi:DNA processing protein